MRRGIRVVVVLAAALVSPVIEAAGEAAVDVAALMTQGKLDADLGNHAAATRSFAAVAQDAAAPASLRWEALVRLGGARRAAGDATGAAAAYQEAWTRYGQDDAARQFLVQAVAGAMPGQARWEAIRENVMFKIDGAKTERPEARVQWPGVPAGPRTYTGSKVSLDFKDGLLQDVFRLFADITGLNVVVHPGIGGTITFGAKDMPWDEALDRILAPHGLVAIQKGNILEIAPPERLVGGRTFTGTVTDVDLKDVALDEAFRRIAKAGGVEATVLPPAAGRVTILLKQVPWDQALDLVARLNGLAWKQDGAHIRVGRAVDLR